MGIYKEVSWLEYWKQVEEFCLGLLELGLNHGDRVAIVSDPCPEWLYADLAIICAGGSAAEFILHSQLRKHIILSRKLNQNSL